MVTVIIENKAALKFADESIFDRIKADTEQIAASGNWNRRDG